MKKFFQELKDFALKGNVMDMAVGVIIGTSFQGIVTSLTNDILNPILGIAFSTDFSNVVIPLFGDNCIYVGSFLSAVINFILMAFVLFCLVKAMNRLMALGRPKVAKTPAAPKGPTQEELLAAILKELRAQNERETSTAK